MVPPAPTLGGTGRQRKPAGQKSQRFDCVGELLRRGDARRDSAGPQCRKRTAAGGGNGPEVPWQSEALGSVGAQMKKFVAIATAGIFAAFVSQAHASTTPVTTLTPATPTGGSSTPPGAIAAIAFTFASTISLM